MRYFLSAREKVAPLSTVATFSASGASHHGRRYFDDTDAMVLAQDKLLQHDMWGKTNPLPSTIFAKLQKDRSTLDPKASRYEFDIVL